MSTTRPEDIAAMFDLPPPEPESAEDAAAAAAAFEAAEAALAMELEAELDAEGVADDAPDSRARLRAPVAWPARMKLARGAVIELQLRNISEVGVGLASDQHVPANTVVHFEMDVPPLAAGGAVTPVEGTIRTTYTVTRGAEILFGGTWVQAPADGLALVDRWLARLLA